MTIYPLNNIQSHWVEPEDKHQTLLAHIQKATKTIDISIYQVASPYMLNALCEAKKNGIHIRIIVNGQYVEYGFSQAVKFLNPFLTFRQQLIDAPGPGTVQFHWASNNIIFHHIKSLIIDAKLPTQQLIILTGNLYDSADKSFSAEKRDFAFATNDANAVAEAIKVFEADFGSTNPSNTLDLKNTTTGLLWSNGSTDNTTHQYPQQGRYLHDFYKYSTNQGNVRDNLLYLLDYAHTFLDIYAEELNDSLVIDLLFKAKQRGVKVRILLNDIGMVQGHQKALDLAIKIEKSGINIYLVKSDVLYIHAKTYVCDDDQGSKYLIAGSQNPSFTSLNYNRELGLITSQANILATVQNTFEQDWQKTLQGMGSLPSQFKPPTLTTTNKSQSEPPNTGIYPASFLSGIEIDIHSISPTVWPKNNTTS